MTPMKPNLAAAFTFSFGMFLTLGTVQSFSPSTLSHSSPCNNALIRAKPNANFLPLRMPPPCPGDILRHSRCGRSSYAQYVRLNAVSKDKESSQIKLQPNSMLEPGGFPTIVIEDPPQKDLYKQAIERTLLWVSLALAFGVGLGFFFGPTTSEEFFAGYLVEQSLSVDNLFVFLLLFEYFRVPLKSQDRVLNWGIYGAIIMRAVMIGVGAAALEKFHAILLLFAAILVYSSAKTLIPGGDEDEEEDLDENAIVKFSRNLIESTDKFDGSNFFTIIDGVKKATPLFICMIALEVSDVVFAVDSIPAVFGVTENPLVVFSSNMFAIMGLRSLYTILSKAASDLKYLEPAVGIVLGFIGGKMIAEYFGAEVPTETALGVVAFFLTGGVVLSLAEKDNAENLNGEEG